MTAETFDLFRVVDEYDGPPLKMVLAGTGSYAARILEVPGVSDVLDSIYLPYSAGRVLQFIMDHHPRGKDIQKEFRKTPSVSQQMCEWLHESNCVWLQGCFPLTITAAVTSKKQRQGENQAYIGIGLPGNYDIWHVQLARLEDADFEDVNKVEARRFVQDRIISEIALSLATGISSILLTEMEEAGYVRKL